MIKQQKIFFAGIGGIGISALARILKQMGKDVSGSDIETSPVTESLAEAGIEVKIGDNAEFVPDNCELLIYSNAVPETDPQRQEAKKRRIKQMTYPQALGELSKDKKVIAVAGTNGKTTTTAMIAAILETAGEDYSAVIGSTMLSWNSNARLGRGKYFVLEADEYRRAFLNYRPFVAVITNIVADHLDYFKDFDGVKKAFGEFINGIEDGGNLIYNRDDPACVELAYSFPGLKVSFGFTDYADFNPGSKWLSGIKLKVPGSFNLANALAAAAACRSLGVKPQAILDGLNNFTGTWRRFQHAGYYGNTEIVSDYAHHPDGLTVTLDAAAEVYQGKRVLAVFQPHQHNRTKTLFKDFVKSLCQSPVRHFIISEIFDVAGREESKDQDVSSKDLVREIAACGKEAEYARDLADCEQKVRDTASVYDVIIFLGAGDIYKLADKFANEPAK